MLMILITIKELLIVHLNCRRVSKMDVDNDPKMLLFQLRWIWILNAHKHLPFVRTLSAVLGLPRGSFKVD